MTRDDYEERKRRIEEQLRAGIELLEAACRQQIRALDLVWMTTAEGDVVPRLPAALGGPPASAPSPPAAASPPPPLPHRPPRRPAWQLLGDIEAALGELPEVFDRNDICQAVGYEPERSSLYRILQQMIGEGTLALADRGVGKKPSRYRRLGPVPTSLGN